MLDLIAGRILDLISAKPFHIWMRILLLPFLLVDLLLYFCFYFLRYLY
jgi:hypothetical protein